MRRTVSYAAMTKGEAQRSIRTFYEVVKKWSEKDERDRFYRPGNHGQAHEQESIEGGLSPRGFRYRPRGGGGGRRRRRRKRDLREGCGRKDGCDHYDAPQLTPCAGGCPGEGRHQP